MANWAVVENNQVTELYDLLPNSWRNISGLNLSANDTDFLESLGWYPIVKAQEEYDGSLYCIDSYSYDFINNQVIESFTLKDIPPQPTYSAEGEEQVRERRNRLLAESDWVQLADVQAKMAPEPKLLWAEYRQKLRDIMQTDISNGVIWPEKPTNPS